MHEYPAIVGVSWHGRVMYEMHGEGFTGEHVHSLPVHDILPDEVPVLWRDLTEKQRVDLINLEELRAESPEALDISGIVHVST